MDGCTDGHSEKHKEMCVSAETSEGSHRSSDAIWLTVNSVTVRANERLSSTVDACHETFGSTSRKSKFFSNRKIKSVKVLNKNQIWVLGESALRFDFLQTDNQRRDCC